MLKESFDMSLKEIEVICVFDGADAELEKVAGNTMCSRLSLSMGAPKARNEGFKHTKGKYISFGMRIVLRSRKWRSGGSKSLSRMRPLILSIPAMSSRTDQGD